MNAASALVSFIYKDSLMPSVVEKLYTIWIEIRFSYRYLFNKGILPLQAPSAATFIRCPQ
jgi:hypothetical protein